MLCIIEHPSEAAAEPVPAGIADKRGFLVPTADFLLVLRAVRIAATTRRLALTFPTEAALPAFRNLRACIMADTAVAFRGGYQFPVCFDLTAYSRAILANIFCNLRNLQPCCNPEMCIRDSTHSDFNIDNAYNDELTVDLIYYNHRYPTPDWTIPQSIIAVSYTHL